MKHYGVGLVCSALLVALVFGAQELRHAYTDWLFPTLLVLVMGCGYGYIRSTAERLRAELDVVKSYSRKQADELRELKETVEKLKSGKA